MTSYNRAYFAMLLTALLIWPLGGHAGKNPIKWSLNHEFQVPLIVSRTYSISYTLTNQLPIPLIKPIVISKLSSPASEFTYEDNCSGLRLAVNQSCTVTVSITPLVNGTKFVQLTMGGYDNNEVKFPEVTSIATGSAVNGVVAAVTHWLPYQMNLGTSADYTITFTNEGGTEATNVVSTVTQSNGVTANIITNTCMFGMTPGTIPSVNNGGYCYISGSYNASVLGEDQSVTASLTFDGADGSPAVVSTYTTVVSPGGSGEIVGSLITPDYLPPIMTQNTGYPLAFLFTNVSNSQVNFAGLHVGSVTCEDSNHNPCGTCNNAGCSGQLSGFSSNCNNDLPYTNPAAACELQATFTSPAATNPLTGYTVTASVPYTGAGSPATVSTTGTVVTTLPTTRTITISNQCNFNVWFSLNGASVAGNCNAQGVGCSPGTSCDTTKGTCFWANPTPNGPTPGGAAQIYELPQNTQNTVTIPAYNYGGVQWSGNLSASTLCNGTSSCGQADCKNNGGSTSCSPGKGFSQPATEAEFTLNAGTADSYDVGVINGFHIPISMKPFYYTGIPATANGYTCGTAGAFGTAATDNGFGSCNWGTVTLPSPTGGTGHSSGYYWVTNNGTSCDINNGASQCGTTQLCGLALDTTTNTFSQACGSFLGYWTGDQVCSYGGLSTAIDTFFNCSTQISSLSASGSLPFPAKSTLYDLMTCSVPTKDPYPLYNSCYNSYPGSTAAEIDTCCGCVNWWVNADTPGANIEVNQNTQSCGTQIDPVWTQYIQPMVQWLKAACPSAYTYPFDDKTSGFGCSNNLTNEPNSVDYQITFCDGDPTGGLPTGITEGR